MITFLINKKNKKALESIIINDFIKFNYEIIFYDKIEKINFNKIKTKYFCLIKNHSYFNSVILDEINFNFKKEIILFPEIYEKNNVYLYLNIDKEFYKEKEFKFTSSFFIDVNFFIKKKNFNINNFIINNLSNIEINEDFDFLIFNNRGKNLNEN